MLLVLNQAFFSLQLKRWDAALRIAERSPFSSLPFSTEHGTELNWTGMPFFLLLLPLQTLHLYFTM